MAAWEDVNKLRTYLEEVYTSSTKQKLSERNVIEIVSKLIEQGLVEVIYTIDGKEYITPQELAKEIKEELQLHGGRINLVELTQILNVDFRHVESKVSELAYQDRSLTLILGQLIDKSYMDTLAEEVNDKLQEQGYVTIPELTKQYDLPAEFLVKNLHACLGTTIKGHVDSYDKDVIYTDDYVSRMKAQIRGAFSAITRPVLLGSLIQQYKFRERIFFSILEELVNTKRLSGTLSGGRQDKATYIPDIYTKSQTDWVDNFYKQNGYLEYDAIKRLGISDPKDFIKKRFKSEDLVFLSSCCMGQGLREQVEANIEEALSNNTWIDIMLLLPSVFSPKDASTLLTAILKPHHQAIVCNDTIVASDKLVAQCSKPFTSLMAQKAEQDAKSHPVFRLSQEDKGVVKSGTIDGNTKEDKKDKRRKKAASGSGSVKTGGGTQGREVKTKSLKKKGHRGQDNDNESDEEATSTMKPKSRLEDIEFMTLEEIEDVIKADKSMVDCPKELITEIAQQLIRPLNRQYQDIAKSIFLQASGSATNLDRKKTHVELQDKLSLLWTDASLFEKGLNLFPDSTRIHLIRHLQRTLCTDMTNIVLNAVAADHMLSVADEAQLTMESRGKIISKLPSAIQGDMMKLHNSLNSSTLNDFFNQFDVLCGPTHLDIKLKKPDKKKERQLTFNHRQLLCEQLSLENDPARVLHFTCVILFHKFTGCIVHMPGKCVPQVLVYLQDHLQTETFQELITLQDLVIAKIQKLQAGDSESKEETNIEENVKRVKEIAITTKKSIQNNTKASLED